MRGNGREKTGKREDALQLYPIPAAPYVCLAERKKEREGEKEEKCVTIFLSFSTAGNNPDGIMRARMFTMRDCFYNCAVECIFGPTYDKSLESKKYVVEWKVKMLAISPTSYFEDVAVLIIAACVHIFRCKITRSNVSEHDVINALE